MKKWLKILLVFLTVIIAALSNVLHELDLVYWHKFIKWFPAVILAYIFYDAGIKKERFVLLGSGFICFQIALFNIAHNIFKCDSWYYAGGNNFYDNFLTWISENINILPFPAMFFIACTLFLGCGIFLILKS